MQLLKNFEQECADDEEAMLHNEKIADLASRLAGVDLGTLNLFFGVSKTVTSCSINVCTKLKYKAIIKYINSLIVCNI